MSYLRCTAWTRSYGELTGHFFCPYRSTQSSSLSLEMWRCVENALHSRFGSITIIRCSRRLSGLFDETYTTAWRLLTCSLEWLHCERMQMLNNLLLSPKGEDFICIASQSYGFMQSRYSPRRRVTIVCIARSLKIPIQDDLARWIARIGRKHENSMNNVLWFYSRNEASQAAVFVMSK